MIRRLPLVALGALLGAAVLCAQAPLRKGHSAGTVVGGGGGGGGITFDSGFSGTGTFSDGQSVTLTRSSGSWGTKANGAKPLWWYPLETNGSADATYSRTTTTPFTPDGAISTVRLATGQAGSWRKDLAADAEPIFVSSSGFPFTSDTLYIWYRMYYDFSWAAGPEFNLKETRLWQAPAGAGQVNTYHSQQGNEDVPNGAPRYSVENVPSGSGFSHYGGHPFGGQQWLSEEFQYRTSTVNVNDGHYDHIRNGIAAWSLTTERFTFRETGNTAKFAELYLSQKSNTTPLANAWAYLDALYIDDSWCRVVISDEATWQTSVYPTGTVHVREPQLITAWSTTSITVTLRKGAYASLVGRYLWTVGNCTADVMVPERHGTFS